MGCGNNCRGCFFNGCCDMQDIGDDERTDEFGFTHGQDDDDEDDEYGGY